MNDPSDYANVPLVMYINGERKVIGEATINGREISTTLNVPIAEDVMGFLIGSSSLAQFSLNFSLDYDGPVGVDSRQVEAKLETPIYLNREAS